ncbi:MAG TPA: hypothetical protein VM681_00590 [Candidatus Thermoplasmatota archaeon]|nr:hypothetical protein [Candidatus Thermoplasmatota archaeon]
MKRFLPAALLLPLLLAAAPEAMAHAGHLHILEEPSKLTPLSVRHGALDAAAELAGGVVPQRGDPRLAPVTAGSYSIQFQCPPPVLDFSDPPCPLRIIDVDDLLGNPTVAVSPLNPNDIILSSLHGTLQDGPTARSRGRQTHTTFTHSAVPISTSLGGVLSAGQDWQDQPYFPPDEIDDGRGAVYGEDVHAIMNEIGNIYIASLYSKKTGADWQYYIANWKFDPDLGIALNYAFPNGVFTSTVPGRAIDRVWLAALPASANVALFWEEREPALDVPTEPPADEPPSGNESSNQSAPPPRDRRATFLDEVRGPRFLVGAITPNDLVSGWKLLNASLAVGPCASMSNAASYADKVYVACTLAGPAPGFPHGKEGDVVVYEIDPVRGVRRALTKAPVPDGQLTLSVSQTGRMAIASVQTRDGTVAAQLATGPVEGSFGRAYEFAERIRDPLLPAANARVNSMLYRSVTNTIHLLWIEESGDGEAARKTAHWRKALVVLDPLATPLVNLDLDVRDRGEVFRFDDPPRNTGAYADTRDSLIEVEGREFMVFTDYSIFVFAEILELDEREDAIVFHETPPVPEAVPVAEVAPALVNVGAGVVAAAVSAEALRRLLAARLAAGAGPGRRRR